MESAAREGERLIERDLAVGLHQQFNAGLIELGGAGFTLAEDRAEIGEGRRLAHAIRDIGFNNGQREIRAQAVFGAGGIGSQQ